jgi:hypothetical protein
MIAQTPHMTRKSVLLFVAALVTRCVAARADVFVINSAQSTLTLSGSVLGFASPVFPQSANSLSTSYTGLIDATVGSNSIQFNNATVDASVSGVYQPAVGGAQGTAPGDYGGVWSGGPWTGYFAVRDSTSSLSSAPVTLTGGNFDASEVLFSFLSGSIDRYILVFMGNPVSGTQPLLGINSMNGTGTGMLSTLGPVQTLTIPIDVTFTAALLGPSNDSTLRLRGNLVATSVIPEPATYALLLLGILLCVRAHPRLFQENRA